MRRPLVPVVLGLALLAGCTPGTARETAPTAAGGNVRLAPAMTLTCQGAIDGSPPPAEYETVLDVVALPTGQALEAYDSGDPTVPALFAKTGLVVRAGTSFELEAAPQPEVAVAIGWGNRSFQPAPRLVVPSCPDTYGTGWLAYPGGYWVDRPICLPVTVRAAGREQQVRIGVGTACP